LANPELPKKKKKKKKVFMKKCRIPRVSGLIWKHPKTVLVLCEGEEQLGYTPGASMPKII
jgi:hypothetical protein